MDFNMNPLYQKPQINKIFPEIIFDNINYNDETHLIADDIIANDNLDPFDNFFNSKRSRNSSYDENDFQKLISYKQNNGTPNSPKKLNFIQKDINNNNLNGNNIIKINNNINGNNIININGSFKLVDNNKNVKKDNEKKKKVLFNSFQPNKEMQTQKQRQRIKNKLSARKSRLKKKLYVEHLEKEYILVKKELNEMKQKFSLNNDFLPLNEEEYNIKNKKICQNCINIDEMIEEENLILSRNAKNVNHLINSFTAKQRINLEQLLIKQIQVMMPVKIKMFQNKYLKLLSINKDDNIDVIKNKIDENLNAIKELYDINIFNVEEDNGINKVNNYQIEGVKCKSMAYQIYKFYTNLKNYVNEFEKIYFLLV
jgi:hypothetical protein